MFSTIKASKEIGSKYKRYLSTTFQIDDKEYKDIYIKGLDENLELTKGPYLDVNDSFEYGKTIKDYVDKNLLHKDLLNINNIANKTLYKHQEQAIDTYLNEENYVVSTGTGSGKTESFMIPIFDYIMKINEKNHGHKSGVMALIIYPMNALANDQIGRLREYLKNNNDITFGCYTGQTKKTEKDALAHFKELNKDEKGNSPEPLSNEILSRERMKEEPPNILITNYAMLEYLMLRPEDNVFFNNNDSDLWKFIVLDEAHSYVGSTGIEVGMLLRRLKETLNRSDIRYILTSATLGDEDKNNQVAEFASNLTSQTFLSKNIIRAKRIKLNNLNIKYTLDMSFYSNLARQIDDGKSDDEIINSLSEYGSAENLNSFIFNILIKDSTFWKIKDYLNKPKSILEIENEFDISQNELEDFVFIASKAEKDGYKLFDSRYHYFIKATDGIFISLPPYKQLFFERTDKVVSPNGETFAVFEALECTQCHAIYLSGKIEGNYFKQKSMTNIGDATDALYVKDLNGERSDDDSDSTLNDANLNLQDYLLCPHCGFIKKVGDTNSCLHNQNEYVNVIRISSEDSHVINKCLKCEYTNNMGVLRGFFSGQDASTSVVATALFNELPSKETIKKSASKKTDSFGFDVDDDVVEEIPKEKQFLSFSDSRQAAAIFSSYLSQTYNDILNKRIILEEYEKTTSNKNLINFVNDLSSIYKNNEIYDIDEKSPDYLKKAWLSILYELVNLEQRKSLYSLGLFDIDLDQTNMTITDNKVLNLSKEEVKNILLYFAINMMSSAAIDEPIDLTEDDVSTYSYGGAYIGYTISGSSSKYQKSFLPVKPYINKRFDYIDKVMKSKGIALDYDQTHDLLDAFWKLLLKNNIIKFNSLTKYRVDLSSITINKNPKWYCCDKCNKVTSLNVGNVCPSFKCAGKLIEIDTSKKFHNNHYYRLYNDTEIKKLSIREHTAQLNREKAYAYQKLFIDKKVNILSCSTTFEMGVDVGSLETVLMRNMPPSPSNYVQRAGRAGRSKESAALAVTFCTRSNHDFNYFNNPVSMIKGKINPPHFKIDNSKIAIRHMYATALAFFWRVNSDCFGKIHLMFSNDVKEDGYVKLYKSLHDQKFVNNIKNFILKAFPPSVCNKLGVENNLWIDYLFGEANDDIYPSLKDARELYLSELSILESARDDKIANGQKSDYLTERINTYKSEDSLTYLSKNNIIPKYGFPVDTVNLYINQKDFKTKTNVAGVELSRDLAMAITEYAPDSQVIANGKLITSKYIAKMPESSWKKYDFIYCQKCKSYSIQVNEGTSDSKKKLNKCNSCSTPIAEASVGTFIVPQFGFISDGNVKNSSILPPNKSYKTDTSFESYDKPINNNTYYINNNKIDISWIEDGRMVTLNVNKYYVCDDCGYGCEANPVDPPPKTHLNQYNKDCKCRPNLYSLGYRFQTDVARILFDKKVGEEAYSLLQAFVIAATRILDLEQGEIDGTLQYVDGTFAFILYDTTPGGAGYSKRLNSEEMLKKLINEAYNISNNCTCGGLEGNTSCYSCLRTYRNQRNHDRIFRRYVVDFLEPYVTLETNE